jgi:hypothetical protein
MPSGATRDASTPFTAFTTFWPPPGGFFISGVHILNRPTSLIADLIARLDPDLRYEYQERAGIMEFDGGLPRDEAEARALVDLLRRHPGALIGLHALQVESRGAPAYVFTTDLAFARDRLPRLGVRVIAEMDPAEVIRTHFRGTALLVSFG